MSETGPELEDRVRACLRPDGPVVMQQSWRRLLFVHWKANVELIQSTLPPGLQVDTFEGNAYVGFVPFLMRNIRPEYCPPVPGISNFLELNVRTYVYDKFNRPGVWFYSLDANQSLAVLVAKNFFHLPYFKAQMSAEISESSVSYSSLRSEAPEREKTTATYSPGDLLPTPQPGSLEYFLLERYYLFSWHQRRKQLYSGQVHHTPYPAFEVEVENLAPEVMHYSGLYPSEVGNCAHQVYSPGVDVDVFALEAVR